MNSVESLLREKIAARIEEEKKRVAAMFWEAAAPKDPDAHTSHPLHKLATKHGYEHTGPGTTTTGGGTKILRHEYKHPKTGHQLTLGTHQKSGTTQHFWNHEDPSKGYGGAVRHHGVTSHVESKKLKYSLNKQLNKTHAS